MLHLSADSDKGFAVFFYSADVAELADAPDLGSGVHAVQVQVLSSAYENPEFSRVLFLQHN